MTWFSTAAAIAVLASIANTAISPTSSNDCATSALCDLSAATALATVVIEQAAPEIDTASGRPCRDAPAFVRASGDERRLICGGIKMAVDALAVCGIKPRAPIYAEQSEKVVSPDGDEMFGLYDRVHDTVVVASAGSVAKLMKDTPYAAISVSEFYRSMVVHETVHAIMEANQSALPSSRSAQEYAPYAIQWATMAPATRQAFLRQFDLADTRIADVFADAILMFDPYYFGARAYTHFDAMGQSCSVLNALLADRASFIAQQ